MACEIWLRRDYLIRHGRAPDEPPCGHDPQHCPPPVPADAAAIDARRLGEEV
jgi:hypothetical protein